MILLKQIVLLTAKRLRLQRDHVPVWAFISRSIIWPRRWSWTFVTTHQTRTLISAHHSWALIPTHQAWAFVHPTACADTVLWSGAYSALYDSRRTFILREPWALIIAFQNIRAHAWVDGTYYPWTFISRQPRTFVHSTIDPWAFVTRPTLI